MTAATFGAAPSAIPSVVDVLRDLNEVQSLLKSVRREAVQSVLTRFAQTLLQTLEMHQPPHPSAPLAVNLDSAHFSSQPKSLTGTFSGYASLEGLSSSGSTSQQILVQPPPGLMTLPSSDCLPGMESFGTGCIDLNLSSPSLLTAATGTEPLLMPSMTQSLTSLSDIPIYTPPTGMGLAQDVQALSDLQLYESLNAPCQEDPTSFLTLTACSWEQDVSCLKVYIPLRGVHNEMIRTHFTRHSAEVTVYNLQGRNYVFRISPTFRPVQPEACYAVASKTKKNVLLTIKKLSSSSKDDKHWRDLQAHSR